MHPFPKLLLTAIALISSCAPTPANNTAAPASSQTQTTPPPTESPQKTEPQTCLGTIEAILTTSPAFLKMTDGLEEAVKKNGGTSFGYTLEGSPDPKGDGALDNSETYDFSLHETYPDRENVIARFTFNQNERQLYEYDPIEDQLNPIDFDKELLKKFDELCR